jgi:serine/threonine protein kinase
VITQAARGLAYAHEQGLVHRDVKPGNLLVTQEGRVKVLDLGLAGSTLDPETVSTGRIVGTMDYMAPEQIRTPDAVGPAADVYSLGCTLYFVLTGQVPFPGGTRREKAQRQLTETPVPLGQIVPHVDPELCRVVAAMMHKAVDERIGSAAEVIQRLRPWTPRTLVPMSRTPVSDGDHRPIVGGLVPPPLPAAARRDAAAGEPSSSHSSRGVGPRGDEGWPTAVPPVVDGFSWTPSQPPRPGLVDASRRFSGLALTLRRGLGMRQWMALALATAAGLASAWVLGAIRGIDPERFDGLLGVAAPAVLGGAVFVLIAAVQVAAGFIRGPKR